MSLEACFEISENPLEMAFSRSKHTLLLNPENFVDVSRKNWYNFAVDDEEEYPARHPSERNAHRLKGVRIARGEGRF